MEYECTGVQDWLGRLEKVYDYYTKGRGEEKEEWTKPTREEWCLKEAVEMHEDKMMVIAVARWKYHLEWIALVYNRRRRLDLDRVEERTVEELQFLRLKETRDKERIDRMVFYSILENESTQK